jgi:hypothetical protein
VGTYFEGFIFAQGLNGMTASGIREIERDSVVGVGYYAGGIAAKMKVPITKTSSLSANDKRKILPDEALCRCLAD